MSRALPVLAVSISLATAVCVGFVLVGKDDARHTAVLDRIGLRLSDVEARLDEVASRRDGRAEVARFAPAQGVASAPEENVEADVGEAESDDSDEPVELATLRARLESVETRLLGLEADPAERAYAYLQSKNPELRKQGVYNIESLAKIDPEARATLRDMLADADAGVRVSTIDTIADIGDKEAAPLVAALLDDENAAVRKEAIDALTRLEAKDAASQIAGFLSDEDGDVRRIAADSMGKLGFKDGADILLAALEDPNGGVRGEAIASLGEIGAAQALPKLRELYAAQTQEEAHRDADHRVRLAVAMKQLGDAAAVQSEIARLGELVHYKEDGGAMRALLWIGRDEPSALPIFQRAAEVSRSDWIRREARRALSRSEERER